MNKLLIVDSNIENIKIIKSAIKISDLDIRHTTTITNSTENICKVIESNNINIVVLNIDMYELRTLSIIKDVISKFEKLRFIYYGKIGDNDYLNKISTMNCDGIAYKPLLKEDLRKVFNQLKIKLDKMEKEKQYSLKVEERSLKYKNAFKDKFLYNLIKGKIDDEDEIFRAFQYYNIDLHNSYQVIVLKIDKFKKILLTLDEQEKNVMVIKVKDLIEFILGNEKHEVIITNFNEFTIILDTEYELDKIISLFNKVKKDIYNLNKMSVTVGIGNTYSKNTDICISFREARVALRYRFHLGYGSVIPIKYVEPNNKITYRYPIEKENKLVYVSVIGEYKHCVTLINEIFDSISSVEFFDSTLVQKIILDILISINRYLTEKNTPIYNFFEEYFKISDVVKIKNVDEGRKYLLDCFEPFCNKMIENFKKKEEEVYIAVENYIEEYYYETIDFDKAAKITGTSVEYIESIFIKRRDMTLSEYITYKRLEKAKKMIRETDKDDEYIAIKNGFSSKKEFKEIFYNKLNCTPSEYRNRYNVNSGIKNNFLRKYN